MEVKIYVSGRQLMQGAKEKYPMLCRRDEAQAMDLELTNWFGYKPKGQYREKR